MLEAFNQAFDERLTPEDRMQAALVASLTAKREGAPEDARLALVGLITYLSDLFGIEDEVELDDDRDEAAAFADLDRRVTRLVRHRARDASAPEHSRRAADALLRTMTARWNGTAMRMPARRGPRVREHRSAATRSSARSGDSGDPHPGDSDDVPNERAAVDALIAASDELERLERDWNPLPAEPCRCEKPWLERLPHVGLHCQRCGHDRRAA